MILESSFEQIPGGKLTFKVILCQIFNAVKGTGEAYQNTVKSVSGEKGFIKHNVFSCMYLLKGPAII